MHNERRLEPNPWNAECPSREVVDMIGDKWVLLLLPKLAKGPQRNGDLMRAVEGISQKMLTQTLRKLEQSGLVHRHDFKEVPPRVEYEFTELGRTLNSLVQDLDQWVVENYYEIAAARENTNR